MQDIKLTSAKQYDASSKENISDDLSDEEIRVLFDDLGLRDDKWVVTTDEAEKMRKILMRGVDGEEVGVPSSIDGESPVVTYAYRQSTKQQEHHCDDINIAMEILSGPERVSSNLQEKFDDITKLMDDASALDFKRKSTHADGTSDDAMVLIQTGQYPDCSNIGGHGEFVKTAEFESKVDSGQDPIDLEIRTSTVKPSGGSAYVSKTPEDKILSTMSHELGHGALGFRHSHSDGDGGPVDYAADTRTGTVMSYRDPKKDAKYASLSPTVNDVYAMQKKWGEDDTRSEDCNTYGFNGNTDNQFLNFSDREDINSVTIVDAGGEGDTLDLSRSSEEGKYYGFNGYETLIDLREGHHSLIGNTGIILRDLETIDNVKFAIGVAHGTELENAVGSIQAEDIYLNDKGNKVTANAGDDKIWGFAGDDVISGNAGNDIINAGAGQDIVNFSGNFDEYNVSTVNAYNSETGEKRRIFRVADSIPDRDGTDSIYGAEFLTFADATYKINSDGTLELSSKK